MDVACTDKTGTLTEGRLSVCLVADLEQETAPPAPLPASHSHVLLTGGLASPHPDDPHASLHGTDLAVIQAAEAAGLGESLWMTREFRGLLSIRCEVFTRRGSAAGFASRARPSGLCPVAWKPAADRWTTPGGATLLERANRLAERGLRVLMVAEGPANMRRRTNRRHSTPSVSSA